MTQFPSMKFGMMDTKEALKVKGFNFKELIKKQKPPILMLMFLQPQQGPDGQPAKDKDGKPAMGLGVQPYMGKWDLQALSRFLKMHNSNVEVSLLLAGWLAGVASWRVWHCRHGPSTGGTNSTHIHITQQLRHRRPQRPVVEWRWVSKPLALAGGTQPRRLNHQLRAQGARVLDDVGVDPSIYVGAEVKEITTSLSPQAACGEGARVCAIALLDKLDSFHTKQKDVLDGVALRMMAKAAKVRPLYFMIRTEDEMSRNVGEYQSLIRF
jgi:hypothetical protein